MNDQELRAIVRDAIARHAAGRAVAVSAPEPAAMAPFAVVRQHSSHALFAVPAGADSDGPCVIELAVACNHCGYCKSYGH
ncbi:MAG TPA: hypothetical protein VM846_09530 [Vicinamibacterales bacterium]|nr:hypothetical protein [Vicinamibacterales bacterium]